MEMLYAQLWHVNASIVAGFTPRPGSQRNEASDSGDVPSAAEIAGCAAEHKDPHVIKFADACARENWLRPNPNFMRAAQSVLERTPRL
jgi:hypothetical protein